MEDILGIIEDFYYDHQRGIMATIIIIIGILIAYIVFLLLYNPVKIKFDGEDYKVVATAPTKLEYKAIAYDKNTDEYPVNWSVSAGVLSNNEGADVVWELPKEAGSYTITAQSGKANATRTVTVIENVLIDSIQDSEVTSADTDMDGLPDEYEENVSKTDSKNPDSDSDSLMDGDEVLLGLNPKLADTKGDGVTDSQRELTYKFTDKNTNATLEIKGNGNLTKTTIDTYNTASLNEIKEIISPVFYIFSEAKIKSISTTLKYDKAKVQNKGLNEDKLSIYKLDEESNKFVKLDSTIDKSSSSITTKLDECAKLFIADSTSMKSRLSSEIMFVIDNSGSMYSKEQIADSSENDVDFKRLSTANKMIDKLKGEYKFGAGKFTFDYTNLAELTTDKEFVKSKIDSIKNVTEKFTGTYIGEALSGGLTQFPDENKNGARRYIILLTDGKDTANVEGYDSGKIQSAVLEAQKKGVKVFTIGLGKEIDQQALSEIATKTNGKYYYALNADILDSLFETIAAQINYDLIDNDNNHIDDSIMIANSGFITRRDGFAFDNVPLANELNGSTYGMSLLSKLYYEKKLPSKLSQMTVKVANSDKVVKAKGFESGDLELSGTLYDNKIEGLEFLFNVPNDFRTGGIEGSVLKIKNEYKTSLITTGFSIYNQPYNKSKAMFDKYEIFILDTESDNYLANMSGSGKGYFDAISRLDILKYRDETISFKDKSEEAMIKLKQLLNSSSTCLLKLNDLYTVNAIRLIEDNANPNKFRIEVYDPNTAGVEKYIECTRSIVSTFNVEDGASKEVIKKYIYAFTYNGKKVDVKISIPNIEENV